MYFILRQNNSGGTFDFNKEYGITIHIIVECDSIYDIEKRIQEVLIYPDRGGDCPCCGVRWDWWIDDANDLDETPLIYGQSPEEYVRDKSLKWLSSDIEDGYEVCIHRKDKTLEWY